MAGHCETIRGLGAEILVVTLASPAMLKLYLAEKRWPFPVVADPELAGYRRFGLARTSWATFFRLGVVARYLKLIFRGFKPRTTNAGEDLLQLGGDFVLDAEQRIGFAYVSREPTDRPAVCELLNALMRMQQGSAGGQ